MANTYREAALILRRLKDRVERLEQGRDQADIASIVRQTRDASTTVDDAYGLVDADPGWEWGASEWNYDEWERREPTATYNIDIIDTRSQPAALESDTLYARVSTVGARPAAHYDTDTYDDNTTAYR